MRRQQTMSPSTLPVLSLCMIVRNEKKYLPDCLDSVRGVVDEMVMVDTGSTDGTQALAKGAGAHVIQSSWNGDFSRARNESLQHAKGRWILVLDADERLVRSEHATLRCLIEGAMDREMRPTKAFTLTVKASLDGGKTGQTARILRLFPNRPDVRYEWPVHEQVNSSIGRAGLAVEPAPVTILHVGYSDPQTNREKQKRNLDILETQIHGGQSVTAHTHYFAGCAHLDLDQYESALHEFRGCQTLGAKKNEIGIAQAAGIKVAECLFHLNRQTELEACFPSTAPKDWHPVLWQVRAGLAHRSGRLEEARRWNECILDLTDTPVLPPVDVAALKSASLDWLANYWKDHGQLALAVQILKLLLSARASGHILSRQDLAVLYRSHGQALLDRIQYVPPEGI